MAMLALLLVFPLVWPFVAKVLWQHEITLGEMALNLVVGAVVVLVGWAGARYSQTADLEVLNGQLTSKTSEHVSCSHTYRCHCRNVCTGTGKNRSCSESCETCSEHAYDVDWTLHTTVGDIDIDRVDRRGLDEPPRWTKAVVGDPVAQTHTFTNYIKAAPDSLFNAAAQTTLLARYGATVPEYPNHVYDIHYVNRVLAVGVQVPDLADWNQELAMRLRTLGSAKQVNWIVLLTNQTDPMWADAVAAKWLGGKKNDVVVVLGTPEYPKVQWASVISWTDKELFKVQLRDDLARLPAAGRKEVFDLLEQHTKASFERKPGKDFSYLASRIEPPGWMLGVLFVVSVLVSVGTSLFLARNDHRPGGFGFRRAFR